MTKQAKKWKYSNLRGN